MHSCNFDFSNSFSCIHVYAILFKIENKPNLLKAKTILVFIRIEHLYGSHGYNLPYRRELNHGSNPLLLEVTLDLGIIYLFTILTVISVVVFLTSVFLLYYLK